MTDVLFNFLKLLLYFLIISDHSWLSMSYANTYMFLVLKANEDCNCYSYDLRRLDEAKCVHRDHVSAVYGVLDFFCIQFE